MSITFGDIKKIKNIDIGIREYGENSGMRYTGSAGYVLDSYWDPVYPDSVEAITDNHGNITLICTLSENDTKHMHQRKENGWPLFVKENR